MGEASRGFPFQPWMKILVGSTASKLDSDRLCGSSSRKTWYSTGFFLRPAAHKQKKHIKNGYRVNFLRFLSYGRVPGQQEEGDVADVALRQGRGCGQQSQKEDAQHSHDDDGSIIEKRSDSVFLS